MPFFIKMIIAAVIGFIFSGLFAHWSANESLGFAVNANTSLAFIAATLLTTIVNQFASSTAAHTNTLSTAMPLTGASLSGDTNSNINNNATAPSQEPQETGVVKWFNYKKGFGFITSDDGEDIFVHFRSIKQSDNSRRGLNEGQRVKFNVVESDKGLQAEDVIAA